MVKQVSSSPLVVCLFIYFLFKFTYMEIGYLKSASILFVRFGMKKKLN